MDTVLFCLCLISGQYILSGMVHDKMSKLSSKLIENDIRFKSKLFDCNFFLLVSNVSACQVYVHVLVMSFGEITCKVVR